MRKLERDREPERETEREGERESNIINDGTIHLRSSSKYTGVRQSFETAKRDRGNPTSFVTRLPILMQSFV